MAGALPLYSQPSLRGRSWRASQLSRVLMASSARVSYSHQGFLPPTLPSRDHTELVPEVQTKKREELMEGVMKMLNNRRNPTGSITLVDNLQQLGVAYHFKEEIESTLSECWHHNVGSYDLFGTSLCFRLLRQQGYHMPSDVFHKFVDEKGEFKQDLSRDLWGLLSLHEASYLGVEGEDLLSQAMEFSRQHLRTSVCGLPPSVACEVGVSLACPRQRRVERFETRRYIETYGKEGMWNSDVFQLATLDFNLVQSLYQQEIAELIRWWGELGLVEKLPFVRDRPLECFLWTVGIFPEPNFSKCRIEIAKAVAILLVLDDVYDSYGSLDELTLFTSAIKRWDTGAIEELPEYMKICYMALYNTTNETGYKVLKDSGWCVVPHLNKQWQDICEAFLIEAKWFCNGFVPTMEDYLENAITTAGTYMALVHAFFFTGEQVNRESVELVNARPKLFSISGRILRLWDDLGTAKAEQQRGDVASSIDCCRKEKGMYSDKDARAHVRGLIDSSWKDLNGELMASRTLSRSMVKACLNLARTSQLMYQHGDDDTVPSIEDNVQSLLIEPIHLK